jgi:ribonuclease HI
MNPVDDQLKDQIEQLAAELGAAPFDLMLVGDGAGSFVATPCGWYVVLYERATGRLWEHWGGAGGGTNNYAELEPFNFAVWAYRHVLWGYHTGKLAGQGAVPKAPRVLVVSDSQVTVRCGAGEYERKMNLPLWASVEWFERKGWRFQWRHVARNSNPFNARADRIAKRVRAVMEPANVLVA